MKGIGFEACAAFGIQHMECLLDTEKCRENGYDCDLLCIIVVHCAFLALSRLNTSQDLSCSGMSEEAVLAAAESMRSNGLQKRGYVYL